ncbi:SIMPL domain-containing protein [Chloroflexota bacterium]
MKKLWLLGAGLVLILGVAGLAGCGPGTATWNGEPANIKVSLANQQEGIWVNGTGKVSAVPDVAILRLGVEAQAATVAKAQSQAEGAMDKVMKALGDSGVKDKDIQTQHFSIQRVTRWDNERNQEVVLGYRVTNTVMAKIRDMDNVGATIDAVAVAGGDFTRVDSISFSVDDPSGYQREARQKAVVDAKAKAGEIADYAGVKLGKPIYITESSYMPSPIYRQDLMEKASGAPMAETPISPGELEISVNVQMAYAILD